MAKVMIAMPDDMHGWLKRRALEERRSLTACVLMILEPMVKADVKRAEDARPKAVRSVPVSLEMTTQVPMGPSQREQRRPRGALSLRKYSGNGPGLIEV